MQNFSVFSLGQVLLVSIEEDISDTTVNTLKETVGALVSRVEVYGVIIDLHNLEVMDSYLAEQLQDLAGMLKLLQAEVVIAGLSVPVVMTLLDFGITLPDMEFALDVEQALVRLQEGQLRQMAS